MAVAEKTHTKYIDGIMFDLVLCHDYLCSMYNCGELISLSDLFLEWIAKMSIDLYLKAIPDKESSGGLVYRHIIRREKPQSF